MKGIGIQLYCMTVVMGLLWYVIVFATSPQQSLRSKKEKAISCGRLQPVTEHNSRPKGDNSGNGCTHQVASAALLCRVKREKIHDC